MHTNAHSTKGQRHNAKRKSDKMKRRRKNDEKKKLKKQENEGKVIESHKTLASRLTLMLRNPPPLKQKIREQDSMVVYGGVCSITGLWDTPTINQNTMSDANESYNTQMKSTCTCHIRHGTVTECYYCHTSSTSSTPPSPPPPLPTTSPSLSAEVQEN